jgi:hypothetical protein
VTRNELDDILKLYFEPLLTRNLDRILNQFSSLQNKILISYMNFIEWVKSIIKVEDNREKREKLIMDFLKRPKTQQTQQMGKKAISLGSYTTNEDR